MAYLAHPVALIGVNWLAAGLLLVGLGLLVRRLWGATTSRAADVVRAVWPGWAAVVLLLQIWHLFMPVNRAALAVVISLALAGYTASLSALRGVLLVRRPARVWIAFAAVMAAAAIGLATRVLRPAGNFDTFHYYLPTVKWLLAYPAVPGLANLFRSLGFNAAHFLYAALVELIPLPLASASLANGPLILAALADGVLAAIRLIRGRGQGSLAGWLLVLLIPAVVVEAMGRAVTLGPDLVVTLLGIITGLDLLAVAGDDPPAGRAWSPASRAWSPADRAWPVVEITLLAAAGSATRLSFAVYGAVTVAAAWGIVLRQGGWQHPAMRRALAAGAAVALLIGGVWAARGVIASGYPSVHVPFVSLPVEWRVPRSLVEAEVDEVTSLAFTTRITPGYTRFQPGWVAAWRARLDGEIMTLWAPLALAGVSVLGLAVVRALRRDARPVTEGWLVLAPPLANLPFWFLNAPHPRFAGATFWVAAAWALASLLRSLRLRPGLRAALAVILAGALSAAALDGYRVVLPQVVSRLGRDATMPHQVFETGSGLRVVVPDFAAGHSTCDLLPLPCTPEPDPALRLRRPGDLRAGFVRESGP